MLDDCCNGVFVPSAADPTSDQVNEREMFFTSTLEIAARSEDPESSPPDGAAVTLRGWRIFILNTTSLSHFTSTDKRGTHQEGHYACVGWRSSSDGQRRDRKKEVLSGAGRGPG